VETAFGGGGVERKKDSKLGILGGGVDGGGGKDI